MSSAQPSRWQPLEHWGGIRYDSFASNAIVRSAGDAAFGSRSYLQRRPGDSLAAHAPVKLWAPGTRDPTALDEDAPHPALDRGFSQPDEGLLECRAATGTGLGVSGMGWHEETQPRCCGRLPAFLSL